MDYHNAFAISAAGMHIERARYEVAAANLANAGTVSGREQAGYQVRRLVATASSLGTESSSGGAFLNMVRQGLAIPGYQIENRPGEARRVLDQGHPLADAQGHIYQPDIDIAAEMMTLATAVRIYEANVAALSAARTMAMRALDIGSNS
ncbi:MAG: flagellar basal body rod protein FlgC [Burkholderiaceae bacterium]|nr:flagellar basal body rod protein FlgC [Burkholderiaceae bacterium]